MGGLLSTPSHAPVNDAQAVGGASDSSSSTSLPASHAQDKVEDVIDGISLAGLRAFVEANGGKAEFEDKTTKWVRTNVVLPAAIRTSYTANLRLARGPELPPEGQAGESSAPASEGLSPAEGPQQAEGQHTPQLSVQAEGSQGHVGAANVYLCHSSGGVFLDVVEAVAAWEEKNKCADGQQHYYFLDTLCLDQYQASTMSFDAAFRECITRVQKIKNTLLVLKWDNPSGGPLKRAWSVLEVAATIKSGSKPEIIMPPTDSSTFDQALVTSFDTLSQMYRVDVQALVQALAHEQKGESDNFDRIIREEGGYLTINQQANDTLQQWLIGKGYSALQMLQPPTRALSLLITNLASLQRSLGKSKDAEALYQEALDGRRSTLGGEHADTLACMGKLALVLDDLGKLAEAEILFRQALQGNEHTLGYDNCTTLESLNNLANFLLFQDRQRRKEAKQLFEKALGIVSSLPDSNEKELATMAAVNNQAIWLSDQGTLAFAEEAEKKFREVLDGRTKFFKDEQHPSTLASINSLALCLKAQGKLGEAEVLFRDALDKRIRTFGEVHPATLESKHNYAALLKDQGKLADAEPLLMTVREEREALLGAMHPSTLASFNTLAQIQFAKGEQLAKEDASKSEELFRKSEELFWQALNGRIKVLGDEHPDTLATKNDLAIVLRSLHKLAEAEGMIKNVLRASRIFLGPDHPDTLASLNNLANLLQAQDKKEDAEKIFCEVLESQRRLLGPGHPTTLQTLLNLSELQLKLGNTDSATEGYKGVELGTWDNDKDTKLEVSHPDSMAAIKGLVSCYLRQNAMHKDALVVIYRAKERLQRKDPLWLQTLNVLGNLEIEVLTSSGDVKGAESVLVDLKRVENEELLRAPLFDRFVLDRVEADSNNSRRGFAHALHFSATSIVVAALDKPKQADGVGQRVALKFMRHQDQFESEVTARPKGISDDFVVGFCGKFSPTEFSVFPNARKMLSLHPDLEEIFKGESEVFMLAMPLGDATLHSVIENESLKDGWVDTVKKVMRDVVGALEHLHSLGFIHGDIKPRNILRTRDGGTERYKLIDLDAARCFKGTANTGLVGGGGASTSTSRGGSQPSGAVCVSNKLSTAYAPPEALCKLGNILTENCKECDKMPAYAWRTERGGAGDFLMADPSFDIWCLGATLFQMLAHRPLFFERKYLQTLTMANPEIDMDVLNTWSSTELDKKLKEALLYGEIEARSLLMQMLEKDPEKRLCLSGVLKHSFLSGVTFDVFISYRHNSTDTDLLAKLLYDTLTTQYGLRVFWDDVSIPHGPNYREVFIHALASTLIFVPLVTTEAVGEWGNNVDDEGFSGKLLKRGDEAGTIDNVFLEWRAATEFLRTSTLPGACPIYVGDMVTPLESAPQAWPQDAQRSTFFKGGPEHSNTTRKPDRSPNFSPRPVTKWLDANKEVQTVVQAVEEELDTHTKGMPLFRPRAPEVSAQGVYKKITEHNGHKLREYIFS